MSESAPTATPSAEPRLPLSAVLFRVVVCTALVAAGGAVVAALVATAPDAGRNAEKAPPPRIAVIEVQPLPVERFVRAYGTVRALDTADVPARVQAVVAALAPAYVAGASVRKGELLAELDARDFLQQVAMAEEAIRAIDAQKALLDTQERAVRRAAELAATDRELAAADLARVERAAAEGAAQPREVDRSRQMLIAATRAEVLADDALAQLAPRRQALVAQRAGESARLELARLSAERCRITAPIDGVLQSAALRTGESVMPGALVARVVNLSRVEIPLRVPASDRALAPVGARVELVDRDGESLAIGSVARIAPEDDPASRTTTVFVDIDQDPAAASMLAPGAFVEARIAPGGSVPRIAVPRRAIRDERISVVENGRVRVRRVTVDFRIPEAPEGAPLADADWAVLSDELPAGTLVVVDGSRSLVEGQEIEPVRSLSEGAR
jgi:RND family efflux transporter MFP subunit